MKRTVLLVAALAMCLVACTDDVSTGDGGAGDEQYVGEDGGSGSGQNVLVGVPDDTAVGDDSADVADTDETTDPLPWPIDTDSQATSCLSEQQCPENETCIKTTCDPMAAGTCMPRMAVDCTMEYAPVCGCDGTTYSNSCVAMSAGQAVNYEGECSEGCSVDADCGKGWFCERESCNAQSGSCVQVTLMCPGIYQPVCGCDGTTYSSSCDARGASQSIDYQGACQ